MARALVIGASGGIGAAFVEVLGATGVEVTALSRSANGLDLRDPASVEALMAALEPPFERVIIASGILAGEGGQPEKSLNAIDATAMAENFAVNAIGPALILKHMPRLLPRQARATVAVLTARVGSIGDNRMGGWYSYRAAKAAANQITHTAAIEIARTHKQAVVVSLHPGTVDTDFTAGYPGRDKLSPKQSATYLLDVLDRLTPEQTGLFFDWRGDRVEW